MPAFVSGSIGGGYDPRYGGVPNLPTSAGLASNLSSILNQAIPGFNGLTKSATGIIGSALAGQVPTDVRNQIADQAAARAVAGGMPGTSTQNGTLFGNYSLRDLGLTSMQQQQQGIQDLLGTLGAYSGTAAPNFNQLAEQENARAQYAAAPIPAAAAAEQQRLFNKYANLAVGGGGGSSIPWWQQGKAGLNNMAQNITHTPYGGGGGGVSIFGPGISA